MATAGFEFSGMNDGSNATPVIRDFVLSTAAAHKAGDLMVLETDGDLTQASGTTTEVTAICQEAIAAASVTAGTTKVKCAILTRNQIWRCSMDAATTSAVIGSTKTIDVVDANTIDADDLSDGAMILWDTGTDDEGNVLAYVVFADTTFGNT